MTLPSPETIGPDPNKDYASIGRSILLERAASGTPRELPKATPWPAPRGWANQNVPLPPPITPAEQSINDMMKLPPDWDYQNPVYKGVPGLGPNGEKLPEDALGWTPFATPYYGPGLEGWWRGTVSRLNAPISYESETIVPIAEPGEELPWYQKALGTLENLGARFYNAGGEEGGGISPGVYVTRGVSEMVKSLLDIVQVPSLGTERLFGTARTIEERYAEEFDLPEPEYKPFWEGWNFFQEFNSFTSPIGWSFKLGQMLGAKKLNTDESYDLLKEGWNTGRIFYSSIVDPAVAQEYKRRYNDAEDPVLLGMELENPMAEMVGQIVMDPLNLLGLGARKLKDARKISSVREDWFTLPKVIDDVLKSVGDVDEIAAVEKVQELAGAVRQAFVKLKDDYRISALTADGKRYIVSRKVNELTQWTVFTNSGGDPEKAMDIIRGAIMLSSDDADEIATGISIIKNASSVSPSPYFSNAGLEMSATMRNLIGVDDAGRLDPERFIDELIRAEQRGVVIGTEIVDGKEVDVIKKGLEGVTHHVSQRMDETINKMFPTITERIKAGEKLPYALKQLGRFDRFAQKSVYKPVNTFFAGIYMGLSPGYAMRNLATNTLHVLVDEGPGALRYKPANLVKKGQAYLGGAMADIGGFGKGVLGVETYEAITRKLPFSRLSEKFEQWGAIQTVSKSIEDSMLKMMKPGRALPDIMPLVEKGMDRDNAELLVRLVIDNKGEVKKAVSEFKEMVSKGNIDAFKTSFWLNDGQRTALHGFEIYDDVMDAISGATTRQEAMDSLSKVFDDVLTDSARVSDEVPRMSEMAEGVEVVDALVDAGVAIPDATIGHATSLFEANSQAMYYMDRLVNDILSSAFNRSDPETAKQLQVLRNKYARIFDGSELSVAKGQQSKFTNEAAGWKKKFQLAEKNTPLATLQKWWKDIGIPGEPPSDLTLNHLWSMMWEEWYFPTSRKHWRDVRDVQYAASETILKEIGDIVPFDDVMNKSLDEPRRLQRVAVKWDEFLEDDAVVFAVNRAIKRNDKAEVARIYARQFLVSDTDQALVDIINANITEGRYAKLADVPPDVSFNAFIRHATGEPLAEAVTGITPNLLAKLDDPLSLLDEEADLLLEVIKEKDPDLWKEYGQALAARRSEPAEHIGDITKYPGGDEVAQRTAMEAAQKNIADADEKLAQATEKVRDILTVEEAAPAVAKVPTEVPVIKPYDYSVKNMSRADLPDYVNDEIVREAENLRSSLSGTGIELAEGAEEGGKIRVSSNPPWYRDLYKEGSYKNRQSVLKALDKIINGNDVARANEKYLPRIKELIIDSLTGTAEAPADPRFLLELGLWDEAVEAYGKYAEEGLIAGLSDDELIKMFGSKENVMRLSGASVEEVAPAAKFVPAPKPVQPYAGGTPSMARVVEQSTDGLRNLQDELLRGVDENWGRVKPQEWSDELEKAVNAWEKGATKGVGEARLISVDVANAARDFTMLSYPQKKYFDLMLAYVYPYHFWYNRTYSNWLKRIATNPEVIAGFAKYQDALGKIHAGAPDWWKYNINSNEVLGIDSDNPVFFNLMSTLNPMQGLTGVDFTDNKKRINWWTSMLDDMNKFGPSTWTPYSIATAAYLYHQGEEEAASRWGGRLIPQTAALKSATALLNIGPPGGLELDPAVGFFSGGMDPYERRQVGRALYGLQEEGLVDPASAIDAAYLQEGEAWDMARDVRTRSRSWGQLASFMFGTGFKARSAEDMEIDRFDAEYFNLWAMEDNMRPEEFQQAMDEMRKDYPFMDAVLLSRKGGLARDRGFAYNVLGRIPPGQKDDISDAAGLDYDYISKFYEDKGHIEDWEETDRQRFMAFVVDVGAILDMPDEATKDEWKMVVGSYSQMMDQMKVQFGEDIQKGIDRFWVIRRDDDEASYAYLEANPTVEQAMTWKDATQINDPLMGKYYVSIQTIERYYNGVMYDAIAYKFGKDVWDIEDGYFEARLLGKKQAKQYLEEFPQLIEKWDLSETYEEETAERIVGVEEMLRSDVHPFLRAGAEARSIAQENIMEALQTAEQTPYELGWQDFRQDMSTHLQGLVKDYVLYDDDLSSAAYDQVEYIARDYNITADAMLQLIRRDMIPQQIEPQTGELQEMRMPPSEGGRQELSQYRMNELLYGFKGDPRLTDHAKKFLASTIKTIEAEQKERDGVTRYGYFRSERDIREHTSYTIATTDITNINLMRHEAAHAIDDQYEVSYSQEFQKLFFPMDTHNRVVEENIDDPYGRVEKSFKAIESGKYMPSTWRPEFFAFLFAELAANPEEVPSEIKKIYRPYINFP